MHLIVLWTSRKSVKVEHSCWDRPQIYTWDTWDRTAFSQRFLWLFLSKHIKATNPLPATHTHTHTEWPATLPIHKEIQKAVPCLRRGLVLSHKLKPDSPIHSADWQLSLGLPVLQRSRNTGLAQLAKNSQTSFSLGTSSAFLFSFTLQGSNLAAASKQSD